MGPESSDEPFDEHLKYCCTDHAVQQPDDGVVCVPEGSDTDLHTQDDEHRDQGSQQRSSPDRDDVGAEWVCELWVYHVSIPEGDGKGTARSWMCFVDSETDGAQDNHGEKINPSELQPLAKRRTPVVVATVHIEESALLALLLSVGQVVLIAISMTASPGAIALPMAHHTAEEAATNTSPSIVVILAIAVAVVIPVIASDGVRYGAIIAKLVVPANTLIIVPDSMVGVAAHVAEIIVLADCLIIASKAMVTRGPIIDDIGVRSHSLVIVPESLVRIGNIVDNVAIVGHGHIIVACAVVCGSTAAEMAVAILVSIRVVVAIIVIVISRIVAAAEQAHVWVTLLVQVARTGIVGKCAETATELCRMNGTSEGMSVNMGGV